MEQQKQQKSNTHTPRFELKPKIAVSQYNKLAQHTDIISYSSKTNPKITPILEEQTNSWFSIHNQRELQYVKDVSRVLYFGLGWDTQTVSKLITAGISNFAVDNEKDLQILLEAAKDPLTIFLRLKLKERSIRSERYFVFGMSSDKVKTLVSNISEQTKHSIGIHVHRKTQNVNEWNLINDISDAISQDTLEKISYVNIGGGLPSQYTNTKLEVIESVLKKIDEFKKWANERNIKVIAEPGRFICAPAVKLITKIVRTYENTIVINASVYNAYTDSVFGSQRLMIEGEQSASPDTTPFLVKGITPDSIDIFRYKAYLKEPKEGDELIFLNAGAYNFATEFCELEKVETVIVK